MKQKQKLVAALPQQLILEVENLHLSKIQKAKLIDFTLLLFKKSNKKHGDFTSPVSLTYSLLQKNYSSNYNQEFVQLAVDSKIIIRDESYTKSTDKKQGKSKTYQINPFYFQSENFDFINVTYTAKVKKDESKTQTQIEKWVTKDMESLRFEFKLLRTMTTNFVDSISIKDFKVNEQIKFDTERAFFLNKKTGETEYRHTKYVVANAKEKNLSVIKTRKGFVIDNVEHFIKEKKNTTYMSFMSSINKLENEPFYATRNETNRRLDNNLTNLCKKLTKQILQHNGLVEIDMNNCQFAIIGNLLPKEITGEKVNLFKDIVASGKLYERMMKLFGLEPTEENRDEMKQLMFQINFGTNPKQPSENYKKICAEFPEVMSWIWDFKKTNGYKSFSVMLQNTESKMFIDDMYFHIKSKMKKFCLTKHDSIICKKEDEEEIRQYMVKYFDSIGFNCSINYTPVKTPVQTNIKYTYTSTTQSNMVAHTSTLKPQEQFFVSSTQADIKAQIVSEIEEERPTETIELILNMQQELFVSYMMNFDDKPINKEIKKKFFADDLIQFERCDYLNKKEWLTEKFNEYHNN